MTRPTTSLPPPPARVWAAFAAMPPVAGLLAYLGFPAVWALGGHDGQLTDPAGAALAFGIIAAASGLIVTIAAAVPLALWLRRRGPVSIGQALATGLVLGNAPFAFYLLGLVLPATLKHLVMGTMSRHLMPLSDVVAGTLRVAAIGSVLGAGSALAFWWLGGRSINVTHDEGDPTASIACGRPDFTAPRYRRLGRGNKR